MPPLRGSRGFGYFSSVATNFRLESRINEWRRTEMKDARDENQLTIPEKIEIIEELEPIQAPGIGTSPSVTGWPR